MLVERSYPATVRSDENIAGKIKGVPIVLEQATDIGGMFKEVIRANAISKDLLKREIKLLKNHDLNSLSMASTLIPIDKLGGMDLVKKDDGIEMDALLNLERTDSKDFYLAVRDGNITGMSFMFHIKRETWEGLDTDYPTRYIDEIDEIVEVSGVNLPAYKQTSIGLRSVDAAETDSTVLEKARKDYSNKRSEETDTTSELELEKLKALYLYK